MQVGKLAYSKQIICPYLAQSKCQIQDLNLVQFGFKIHVLSIAPCYLEREICHKFRREDSGLPREGFLEEEETLKENELKLVIPGYRHDQRNTATL